MTIENSSGGTRKKGTFGGRLGVVVDPDIVTGVDICSRDVELRDVGG